MKDGKPMHGGTPEPRRAASPGRRGARPGKQRGSTERAAARSGNGGHSGYGSESVRPYLREQLRLKSLLPTPFPTPDTQPGKDEHHH
jgi:hypothetical protein